jgi:hypothetical protein
VEVNAVVSACFVVTVLFFCELIAVIREPKPIELIHVTPRVAIGVADIDFQVRTAPISTDRHEYALLCAISEPCSLRFADHERMEQIDVEGDNAAKLWHPKPFLRVGPGEYWLVAAIGPWEGFRAVAKERILIGEP